jgi:hypothetical protein
LEENNKLDRPVDPKGTNHNTRSIHKNTKRHRTETGKPQDPSTTSSKYFKRLAGWPAGEKALAMLKERAKDLRDNERLFPAHLFSYQNILTLIKKAKQILMWPEMAFGTHGLRHGGVYHAVGEIGGDCTEAEISKLLVMSGDMIDHYKRTNTERLAHAKHIQNTFNTAEPTREINVTIMGTSITFNPRKDSARDMVRKAKEERAKQPRYRAPRRMGDLHTLQESLDFQSQTADYSTWYQERILGEGRESRDRKDDKPTIPQYESEERETKIDLAQLGIL